MTPPGSVELRAKHDALALYTYITVSVMYVVPKCRRTESRNCMYKYGPALRFPSRGRQTRLAKEEKKEKKNVQYGRCHQLPYF